MLAINMRIFKTVFVLVILSSLVLGYPLELQMSKEHVQSSKPDVIEDHYDQRQNGTDNYRIHVDGVVLVVAPIEGLLLAGGLGGAENTPNLSILGQNGFLAQSKPETVNLTNPKPDAEDMKPIDAKSAHRSSLRLVNLIAPLLRRIHQ
ncbi:uncharacterized protein LOC107271133 [Cephus cinctus]|uniref:Uncharacterized protein LOC107271133 n=1 Tax=Cephus cinctus TaxID=211228 RepID=A0AAJ7W4G5_CEPCN|nr:uncharacterized protein LOC107271133 [Cephus cinctus]